MGDTVGCSVRVDQKQKDVARAIGVNRWRCVAADGIVTHDTVFLDKLVETFEVERLSVDETKGMM